MVDSVEQAAIDEINRYRYMHGRGQLHLHHDESNAARKHSEYKVERGEHGHSPEHMHPGWVENWCCYEGSDPHEGARKIVQSWMENDAEFGWRHKETILRAREHAAVGVHIKPLDGVKKRVFLTCRFR